VESGRFRLNREPAAPPPGLVGGRWLIRGLLLVAMIALAALQGLSPARLVLLGVAILWALSLPWLLRAIVRATADRPAWQRYALVALAAVLLLAAFFFGVQALLAPWTT
jgi:hypothetical protein